MVSENILSLQHVQIVEIHAPPHRQLMKIVNKQKAIVNYSYHIKMQINELSEVIEDLNNTAIDNLAGKVDSIKDHFETFHASLICARA